MKAWPPNRQGENLLDIFDITIVGAGPVGLFATFYAGMRNMRTKVIDALPETGGQMAVLYPEKFVYDIPCFPRVKAADVVERLMEQTRQFGPTILLNERVNKLSYESKTPLIIRLESDKATHFTRSVLISGGIGAFTPNKLSLPGLEQLEGKGVYYNVTEKSQLREKRVLIVGGGDSAVDWALNLQHWASEVTLIHRRDSFRAHEASVKALLASDVRVKLFHELKEVHGRERVVGVTIFDNRSGQELTFPVDGVLIFVGYKADLGPISTWGLQVEGRAIKVTNRMETNLLGVYAAGDIASPQGIGKLNLIVLGFAQATLAVNFAKNLVDPKSNVYPGHSSDKKF